MTYTTKDLESLSKEDLIALYMKQEEQLRELQKQHAIMAEAVAVLKQQRFGRKTEKSSEITGQLFFDPFRGEIIFNEAEVINAEHPDTQEPEIETVIKKRGVKGKGTRDKMLKDIPVKPISHELTEEELKKEFPNGYRRLPDHVYRELNVHPENFEVLEHHVAVYAANKEDRIVRAPHPARLFGGNSLATPELMGSIISDKYLYNVPFERIHSKQVGHGVDIPTQNLSRWCVMASDLYLEEIFEEMHREMIKNSRLIHADESPFKVTEELKERGPDSKCYMWVYHTDNVYGSHPIFLYRYCPTRSSSHPEEFLDGYNGILMTDGYEAYHKLGREHPDTLRVAGCWAHAKRRFSALLKADKKQKVKGTVAYECHTRIAAIYHLDNMYKELSPGERLKQRKTSVAPLADAFFEYAKKVYPMLDPESETGKAVKYCINQEPYLRLFLTDGIIPLDNNDAERSIRNFCVGRANFHVINSKAGAKASGILYSITETAKANGLIIYKYIAYILRELSQKQGVHTHGFLKKLLPWSEDLPEDLYLKPKA